MSDAVLCELVMKKLPSEVQLALVTALGQPLQQFATVADAAVQRLGIMNSIHSVDTNKQIFFKADSVVSDNSLRPTSSKDSLDAKISSLGTQLERLTRDIGQLQSAQFNNSASSRYFSPNSSHRVSSKNFFPRSHFRFTNPDFRPRSSRFNSVQSHLCYYHHHFGQKSHKCLQPCAWQEN